MSAKAVSPDDDPEVIGAIADRRASHESLTPEELELHELREATKRACAKGVEHCGAVVDALAEATGASVLVVRPVDFKDAETTTRIRDLLSKVLGCGIAMFPSSMNALFTRAVEIARAEVREAAAGGGSARVN